MSLNAKDLISLRQQLPEFDLQQPVQSAEHALLAEYWQFYGFDYAIALCDSYHFGLDRNQNYALATHCWRQKNSRGTVLVLHGLFDHVALYLPLVEGLLRQGYSVLALDLPEHGLSSGEFGQVQNFSEYTLALSHCLERHAANLPEPFFAVAQSTGCAVVMQYLLTQAQTPLRGAVLLAPLIRPRAYWSVWLSHRLLRKYLQRVSRKFTVNSHDAAFCNFLKFKDPCQPRDISVPWVGAMLQWVKEFDAYPPSLTPLRIVQGTADTTVDFRYNLPHIQAKFPHSSVTWVQGAMHHLVRESEPYRAQVYDAVYAFLAARR